MRRQVLSAMLLVLLSAAAIHAGQETQRTRTASVDLKRFSYVDVDQRASQWCWAACIEMVLGYHGVRVEQEAIVARSYGTDPYGNLPNWAGNEALIARNLTGEGEDLRGRRFDVRCSYVHGAPAPQALIRELEAGRPVILGYRSGPTTRHAVVCTSVKYVPSERGPIITRIGVHDPWPLTREDVKGQTFHEGARLASLMSGSFAVKVRTTRPVPTPQRCQACDGTRRADCPRCLDGRLYCQTCDGTGGLTCARCNGSRQEWCIYGGCPGCRRSGGIHTCPGCNGRGGVQCRDCRGRPVIDCPDCANGSTRCRACG